MYLNHISWIGKGSLQMAVVHISEYHPVNTEVCFGLNEMVNLIKYRNN